jgi:hypothetical protein
MACQKTHKITESAISSGQICSAESCIYAFIPTGKPKSCITAISIRVPDQDKANITRIRQPPREILHTLSLPQSLFSARKHVPLSGRESKIALQVDLHLSPIHLSLAKYLPAMATFVPTRLRAPPPLPPRKPSHLQQEQLTIVHGSRVGFTPGRT